MTVFKNKIASKLMAGMALVLISMIMSSGILALTFLQFQKNFSEISARKLPGLIGASQLIRETEQLTANAPDIIIAKNQYIRDRFTQDIEEKIRHKVNLTLPVLKAGISKEDINLLSGQFDLVFENLRTLIDITTRQFQTEYLSKQISLRLYIISRKVDTISLKSESSVEQNEIFNIWHNSINQAINDMLFIGNINNDGEFNYCRKTVQLTAYRDKDYQCI